MLGQAVPGSYPSLPLCIRIFASKAPPQRREQMVVSTSVATGDSVQKNDATVQITSASQDNIAPSDQSSEERVGSLRKFTLLCIFCVAQFLDTFNISSLYSAIPTLETAIGITPDESPWLVSAFQLTFASFLLMVGYFSPVYCLASL